MVEITPMMRQYFELKQRNPDCLLFFRLGDFYELFFEDAELASRELELTLTGRACGGEDRAPMCGVPFHAANTYVARLIEKGYKVAIAEQMEDPALAKGLVERAIIRIVTPGTLLEENLLVSDRNNYLACATFADGEAGLAYADISTGEFALCAFEPDKDQAAQLADELTRLAPSEVLTDKKAADALTRTLRDALGVAPGAAEEIDANAARDRLCAFFGAASAKALSGAPKGSTRAAGALLRYIEKTQCGALSQLTRLDVRMTGAHMRLDPQTIASLELVRGNRTGDKKRALLGVLDETDTAMGARMLRRFIEMPLSGVAAVNARLDAVSELYKNAALSRSVSEALKGVADVERLAARVSGVNASARDLLSLGASLSRLPALKAALSACGSAELIRARDGVDSLEDLAALVASAISDKAPVNPHEPGVIADGFDAELDALRDAEKNGRSWLSRLETREREETGIKNLRVGYNRVFGYYIEVTKSNYGLVPLRYTRRQTLASSERYVTEELREIEEKINSAVDKIASREYMLFEKVRDAAAANVARIQLTARAVAQIDALNALSGAAHTHGYVRPVVDDSCDIDIKNGRHPVVEAVRREAPFVPNDALLDGGENRFLIVTGPNMAGKSTYLRQVALIVLMAHMGSFVPADSARIGLVDGVFTRIGASDDLSGGQSTFMLEMNEVAHILKNATRRSLLILDEVGRGTSTFDGLSIAWAVTEYISQTPGFMPRTLFATHYHELTELEGRMDGVKNYCVSVRERGRDVYFLRKILRGGADKSFGIHVARMAGLPEELLARASTILRYLERSELGRQTKKIIEGRPQQETGRQVALFADDSASIQILGMLRDADVEAMTPIDALNFLAALKNKLSGGNA